MMLLLQVVSLLQSHRLQLGQDWLQLSYGDMYLVLLVLGVVVADAPGQKALEA